MKTPPLPIFLLVVIAAFAARLGVFPGMKAEQAPTVSSQSYQAELEGESFSFALPLPGGFTLTPAENGSSDAVGTLLFTLEHNGTAIGQVRGGRLNAAPPSPSDFNSFFSDGDEDWGGEYVSAASTGTGETGVTNVYTVASDGSLRCTRQAILSFNTAAGTYLVLSTEPGVLSLSELREMAKGLKLSA